MHDAADPDRITTAILKGLRDIDSLDQPARDSAVKDLVNGTIRKAFEEFRAAGPDGPTGSGRGDILFPGPSSEEILQAVSDAVITVDGSLIVRTWNPAAERLFGYGAEEMLGRSALRLLPEGTHDGVFEFISNLPATQTVITGDIDLIARDGRRIPFEVRINVFRNKEGLITHFIGVGRDISEEKAALKRLEASERELNLVFEHSPLLKFVLDGDMVVKRASRTALDASGPAGPAEYLRPGNILGCVHTEDDPDGCGFGPCCPDCGILNQIRHTLESGEPGLRNEHELSVRLGKGVAELELLVSTVNLPMETGKRVLTIIEDITELKAAYRAIKESEERYQLLFEKAPLGYQSLDEKGRILEVNAEWLAILGYGKEEVEGRWFGDFMTRESRDRFRERFPLFMLYGKARGVEYALVRKTGEERLCVIDGDVTCDATGAFRQTHCIVKDITEQRLAERGRTEADARLRTLIDSASDLIFLKDTDGKYLRVNQAFERFFGIAADRVLGETVRELFDPETCDAFEREDREVLSGKTYRGELTLTLGGGEYRLDTIKVPVCDPDGTIIGLCGISRDVTDEYRHRRQLSSAIEEKNALLQELYHRTKNNMQIIASMINLYRGRVKDPAVNQLLQDLRGKIFSMALVHQKLYQSRNLSRIDLKDYLGELARFVFESYNAQSRAIRLAIECESVPGIIDIAIPLGLVIHELLTNALKYAFPEKSGTVTLRLMRTGTGLITVEVSDDGIGIPDSSPAGSPDTIGIRTIQSIVEHQLKGKIVLESSKGTAWIITIPDRSSGNE